MVYDNTQTLQSLHLDIPEEIMEEIMYRLPVKSLMRFKSVSKSWRSLIDSDRFIKNHYRNSTANTSLAHHRVIFNGSIMGMKHCSLQSMLKRPRIGPSPFDEEMYKKLPMTGHAWLVGCCNGLFCLVNNLGRYFLWNPATKIFFQLPDIPRVDISLRLPLKRGFGLDESSGAYKVFSLSSDRNKGVVVARVYSSKTNTWTTPVDHGSFSATRIEGVYACGCLHWVTTSCDGIECFDLKSEAFRKMEMPPDRDKYSRIYRGLRLGEVKGWLSVMRERTTRCVVDLWVMKEHGVNESWSKLISFNFSTYDKRGFFRDPINGKMLIISGQSFWVCDDGGVKIRKDNYYERWRSFVKGFGFTGCWNSCIQSLEFDLYQTYLYVETLVSPLPHH